MWNCWLKNMCIFDFDKYGQNALQKSFIDFNAHMLHVSVSLNSSQCRLTVLSEFCPYSRLK